MDTDQAGAPLEWRPVLGFPNYEVSNSGQVRNRKTGRLLRPWTHGKYGHLQMELGTGVGGGLKKREVHRLVLEAFSGPARPGEVARHLDGNPGNNHVANLAWGTHQDNSDDARRHGTIIRGTRVHGARLTEEQVVEIKQARGSVRMCDLARQLDLPVPTISNIWHGYNWAWLDA